MKESPKFSRRRMLKVMGGAAVAAIPAVYGCGDGPEKTPATVEPVNGYQSTLDRYRREEILVEPLIVSLDSAMSDLESKVKSTIDPNDLRTPRLLSVFETYNANTTNKDRNLPGFYRKNLETRGPAALNQPAALPLEPGRFFVGPLPKNTGFAASFYAPGRYILLSEDFNPKNIADQLVAYHETVHVEQDNFVRSGIKTQDDLRYYLAFGQDTPGQRRRIVIEFEYDAYLREMTVLDIITNGEFRKAVEGNTVSQFTQRLGLSPEQAKPIVVLADIARVAFTSGADVGKYTPEYSNFINKAYRNLGYDLYRISPDNKFQLIH